MGAEALVVRHLRDLWQEPDKEQVRLLMDFLSELKRWNRAYSLTSIMGDEEIVIKHFLDSALYLNALPPGTASFADVGSGGGFPGLVMKALMPGLECVLIEPTRKKETFLRHMVRRLGLSGASIIRKRVEEVDGLQVDVAVTRALFSASEFVEKAGHIVREGGAFVLSKGPRAQDEIMDARRAGLVVEVRGAILPMDVGERNLLVVRRGSEEKDQA